jgi:hypothetical protein
MAGDCMTRHSRLHASRAKATRVLGVGVDGRGADGTRDKVVHKWFVEGVVGARLRYLMRFVRAWGGRREQQVPPGMFINFFTRGDQAHLIRFIGVIRA